MYDSESVRFSGHGFTCTRCKFIGVTDSRFENLKSGLFGGAISIIENLDTTSD